MSSAHLRTDSIAGYGCGWELLFRETMRHLSAECCCGPRVCGTPLVISSLTDLFITITHHNRRSHVTTL